MVSVNIVGLISLLLVDSCVRAEQASSVPSCSSYPAEAKCGKFASEVVLSAKVCVEPYADFKCENCISTSKLARVLHRFHSCKFVGRKFLKEGSRSAGDSSKRFVKRQVATAIPPIRSCDRLEAPKPGKLSCRILVNGMNCTGTCNPGYTFSDGTTQAELICRDGDGLWRPQRSFLPCQPHCDPPCQNGGSCLEANKCFCTNEFRGPTCEYPLSRCAILKTESSSTWRCSHTKTDTVCSVSCHPPGSPEAEADMRIHSCSVVGLWTPGLPPCVRSPVQFCQQPVGIPHGKVNSCNLTSYSPGMRVSYLCEEGYAIRGNSEITCQQDGTWSGSLPVCMEDNVPVPSCEDPGDVENGWKKSVQRAFPPGSIVSYSCFPKYEMRGEPDLVCMANREWSSQKPTCLLAANQPNHDPESSCAYSGVPINTEARLHFPSDSETSQVITLKHSDSENHNGNRSLPVGSRIQYRCRSQYYKLYGSEYQTCQDTGSWSGNKPACVPDCGKSDTPRTPFIINGNKTLVGQWPWQMAICLWDSAKKPHLICGGVLISEKWVLTAAHCITQPNSNTPLNVDSLSVIAGKHYRSFTKDDEYVQKTKVRKIIIHENYNFIRFDSDIALVELDPPVELTSRVQPVCLPTDSTTRENIREDQKGVVTGWGLTEEGKFSEALRETVLPVVSHSRCEDSYREGLKSITVTENMFCAGYDNGTVDTCVGDSGGPMVFLDESQKPHRWAVEGIVSWGSGDGCGQARRFAGFTKVRKFVEWIKMFI